MSPSPNPATTEWVPIWNPISEGPAGPPGPQGPPGLSTTVFYFKADATNTQENDPGSGKMRWNAQPQTAATMLYFDRLTDDGFDIIALLQQTTFGTHFTIQDADLSANSQTWKQLAPGVVMGGDWFEVEVEFVSQTGTGTMQNNQRVAVLLDTMIGPHAYTHEPGGDDPLTALDASVLTTGTVDLARLPANVALLDAPNVFTLPNVFTDVTAGVVLATGLSTTPLDASQLTTGTVPDARLSANVQMKPIGLGDLPATVATKPIPESDVTNLVTDLAARVTGPASALNNGIAIWSGTTGKILKDSAIQFANVAIKNAANVFTAANDFTGGSLTAPTAAPGTNTTQVATTAFVTAAVTTGTTGLGNVTGPTSAVASNLAAFADTTGKVIADSTIPLAAVARKDQANTFTVNQTISRASSAGLFLIESGAAANAKNWEVVATGSILTIYALDDSFASLNSGFQINRAGDVTVVGRVTAASVYGPTLLAPLASPVFTGTPTAPTATAGTSTTQVATTAFVVNAIATSTATPAAHHASHETGGSDALVALSAAILTTGTLPDARLSVNVLKFTGGYPGGTTTYLRADGTFAAPSAAGVAAHATTHSPGGSDPLVNAAWTNVANVFTVGGQEIVAASGAGGPIFRLRNLTAPANSRAWHFNLDSVGTLYFVPINDDNSTAGTTYATIARTGDLTLQGNLLVTKTRPEVQLQYTGDTSKGRFASFTSSNVYLTDNLAFDGTNWNRDDVSKGGGLFYILNSGAFGWYRAASGANPATIAASMTIDAAGLVIIPGQVKLTSGYPQLTLENSVIPMVQWNATSGVVDSKKWRLWSGTTGALFSLDCLNDAENAVTVTPLQITRTGNLIVAGQIQLSSGNPGLKFGATAGFGALRNGSANTNPSNPAMVEVVTADTPSSLFAGVRASNFISTSSYNNLADLTVTGATAFNGGITGAALSCTSIYASSTIQSVGVIYPGRVDVAGAQGSWYWGSHGSYGLYTNTNIYVAGVMWVAAWISIGTDCTVGGLLTAGRRFTFRNISSTTYNAVLGDFVLCQGNVTVVLPPPTVDGGVIDVKVYGGAPGTVTVLTASYSYYVDYPAVQYIMSTPNQCATFVSGVSQWFIR